MKTILNRSKPHKMLSVPIIFIKKKQNIRNLSINNYYIETIDNQNIEDKFKQKLLGNK